MYYSTFKNGKQSGASVVAMKNMSLNTFFSKSDVMHVEDTYDPGSCSQANRGQLKLIKDRQDNDKLFLCSKYNKQYIWTSSDGKC